MTWIASPLILSFLRFRDSIARAIAHGKCLVIDRKHRKPVLEREIETLAQSVVEYARMKLEVFPHQGLHVDVEELAFRLRETPRRITLALRLLENQRRGRPTEQSGLWVLEIPPEPRAISVDPQNPCPPGQDLPSSAPSPL